MAKRKKVEDSPLNSTETRKSGQEETKKRRRRKKKRLSPEEKERRAAVAFVSQFGLENLLVRSAFLRRRFVLHVGPTNSGKTYDAIQALRKAETGVYLGPLRLLALEIFDRLNEEGCRCDLLTGEEHEMIEGAEHVASTIELCNYNRHYQVAVIDEAQMLADPVRGAHWTRAILGVDAEEVHICFAPEALEIISWLLSQTGAEYEVMRHERLCPLEFAGKLPNLRHVQPGDALITFSRRSVLGLSAELERRGTKTSVIYGALPPASRREEVRKFAEGRTEIVVATDAIGMGISLPIRRVIFCDTWKYDGVMRRELLPVEVRQIAGRAGRYGIYDVGEVLSLVDDSVVESGLKKPVPSIKTVTMPFPLEALDSPFSLEVLFRAWGQIPAQDRERKMDLSDAIFLMRRARDIFENVPKAMIYEMVTCPVDTSSPDLVHYWRDCVRAIVEERKVPLPPFDTETLEGCELQYRGYDVRSQLMRRIGKEEERKTGACGTDQQVSIRGQAEL